MIYKVYSKTTEGRIRSVYSYWNKKRFYAMQEKSG